MPRLRPPSSKGSGTPVPPGKSNPSAEPSAEERALHHRSRRRPERDEVQMVTIQLGRGTRPVIKPSLARGKLPPPPAALVAFVRALARANFEEDHPEFAAALALSHSLDVSADRGARTRRRRSDSDREVRKRQPRAKSSKRPKKAK